MEKILPSKSGTDTAVINGVYLHSSYDPRREAEKYVDTLDIDKPETVVLLLGACLGYIEDAIYKKYPDIKICRVYFSDFFFSRFPPANPVLSWGPEKFETYPLFLSRCVSEKEFSRLRVVEWEPSFRAFPDMGKKIRSETAQFCRETNGSLLTMKVFGSRWIRNSVKNFLHLSYKVRLDEISGPVLIAASGYNFQSAFHAIRRFRDRFSLWALPSALDFLLHHEILPDLIVFSDPGYYSSFHLHGLLRKIGAFGRKIPLLLPLTAAYPSGTGALTFSFFNQGTWFENELLQYFSPTPHFIPQNGTVAGTAIEIALEKTRGPIFIAGLDLLSNDVFEHLRPHSIDRIVEERRGRHNPEETFRFENLILRNPQKIEKSLRTSPSLRTYAGWFLRRKERWSNRVIRLNPTAVDTGMAGAEAEVLEELPPVKPECIFSTVIGPNKTEKLEILRRFVSRHDLSSSILPPSLEADS